jgi:hypothetical protein
MLGAPSSVSNETEADQPVPLRIGIVGSREIPSKVENLIIKLIYATDREDTIITGGAKKGVDKIVSSVAKVKGNKVILHEPDFSKGYDVREYHKRNKRIVDDSDFLIMFWNKKSKGTLSTLKRLMEALE